MSKATDRIISNAQSLQTQYKKANDLLNDAIKEAVPWAMPLATQGRMPQLPQIERLATQLVAIIMASEPDETPAPLLDVKW